MPDSIRKELPWESKNGILLWPEELRFFRLSSTEIVATLITGNPKFWEIVKQNPQRLTCKVRNVPIITGKFCQEKFWEEEHLFIELQIKIAGKIIAGTYLDGELHWSWLEKIYNNAKLCIANLPSVSQDLCTVLVSIENSIQFFKSQKQLSDSYPAPSLYSSNNKISIQGLWWRLRYWGFLAESDIVEILDLPKDKRYIKRFDWNWLSATNNNFPKNPEELKITLPFTKEISAGLDQLEHSGKMVVTIGRQKLAGEQSIIPETEKVYRKGEIISREYYELRFWAVEIPEQPYQYIKLLEKGVMPIGFPSVGLIILYHARAQELAKEGKVDETWFKILPETIHCSKIFHGQKTAVIKLLKDLNQDIWRVTQKNLKKNHEIIMLSFSLVIYYYFAYIKHLSVDQAVQYLSKSPPWQFMNKQALLQSKFLTNSKTLPILRKKDQRKLYANWEEGLRKIGFSNLQNFLDQPLYFVYSQNFKKVLQGFQILFLMLVELKHEQHDPSHVVYSHSLPELERYDTVWDKYFNQSNNEVGELPPSSQKISDEEMGELPPQSGLHDKPAWENKSNIDDQWEYEWEIGETIFISGMGKKYSVIGRARGGQGNIYFIEDLQGFCLAMKSLPPQRRNEAKYHKSFLQEAMNWIELGRYPYLVFAGLVANINGLPRLFLEYVDGGTLGDKIGTCEPNQLWIWSIQIAYAMEYIHQNGLVHRDLKPRNIFIGKKNDIAKVSDLGLAVSIKMIEQRGGTWPYMPPEQFQGKVDLRSDIYSFGMILYEMWNGHHPFTKKIRAGMTRHDWHQLHCKEKIPVLNDIPKDLWELILKSLEKDVAKRIDSFSKIVEVLHKIVPSEVVLPVPKIAPITISDYIMRGVSFIDLNQGNKAEENLNCARRLDPQNAIVYLNLGLAYNLQGKLEQSEQSYNQAIELNPQNPTAYYNRGVLFDKQRKLEEAEKDLTYAMELGLKDADTYYDLGNVYLRQRKFELAERNLTIAINLDSKYYNAYISRGSVYAEQKKLTMAERDFTCAIELAPGDARAYANRSQVYMKQGKFTLAEQDAKQVQKIDSQFAKKTLEQTIERNKIDDPGAYLIKGMLSASHGELEQAEKHLNQAILLDPTNSGLYLFRGRIYAKQNKLKLAEEDLQSAMKRAPTDNIKHYAYQKWLEELKIYMVEGYINRGLMYANQNKLELAERDLNRTIELDSQQAISYAERGVVYAKQGRLELAERDFNKAIELDSSNFTAHLNRGLMYTQQNKLEKAGEDLNQAIILDLENSTAYQIRGNIYVIQEKLDLAEENFKKAIELDSKCHEAFLGLSIVYALQNKLEKTETTLTKAIGIHTQCEKYRYLRGDVYREMGNFDLAEQDYREVIKLDAQDPHAYYGLACVFSMLNKLEQSLKFLKLAWQSGYHNITNICEESHLEKLRQSDEFKEWLQKRKEPGLKLEENLENKDPRKFAEQIKNLENKIKLDYWDKAEKEVDTKTPGRITFVRIKYFELLWNYLNDQGLNFSQNILDDVSLLRNFDLMP